MFNPPTIESEPSADVSENADVLDQPVDADGTEEVTFDEDFDWRVEQTEYVEQPVGFGAPKYGFANQKSGVFERLQVKVTWIYLPLTIVLESHQMSLDAVMNVYFTMIVNNLSQL